MKLGSKLTILRPMNIISYGDGFDQLQFESVFVLVDGVPGRLDLRDSEKMRMTPQLQTKFTTGTGYSIIIDPSTVPFGEYYIGDIREDDDGALLFITSNSGTRIAIGITAFVPADAENQNFSKDSGVDDKLPKVLSILGNTKQTEDDIYNTYKERGGHLKRTGVTNILRALRSEGLVNSERHSKTIYWGRV